MFDDSVWSRLKASEPTNIVRSTEPSPIFCCLSESQGTDSEPKVDFRMDESSDVPILEDQSSSPMEFVQDRWLVGTDIENIERSVDWETARWFSGLSAHTYTNSLFLLFFTAIWKKWEIYWANCGTPCPCLWKTKVLTSHWSTPQQCHKYPPLTPFPSLCYTLTNNRQAELKTTVIMI